jgi:hypothetical protein
VSLKNIEQVLDLITPFLEGQSLAVINKSVVVQLIGCCLEKHGSSLQCAFVERYIDFLDICIPTLTYITKQQFKIKTTHELLMSMPDFSKNLDTMFITAPEDPEADYTGTLKKEAQAKY